jgi:mannosyltransferase
MAASLAAPVALLAVAALLRAVCLGQPQLFRDEATSWYVARHSWGDIVAIAGHETYPPLYPLLLKVWASLFGDSEAALRSLSVAAGLGTVVVAWRWAYEALGRGGAFLAGLLVAVSPALVMVDRQARMYGLEAFFATLAWWLVWRLIAAGAGEGARPDRRQLLAAAGLALAVAGEVWTMSIGIPTAGLQLAFALAALAWLRTRPCLLASASVALGGLSLTPWLPNLVSVATTGQQFWTPKPDLSSLGYTLNGWVMGDLWGGWGIFVGLAAAAAIAGWTVVARNARSRSLALALALGIALVPATWLYSQFRSIYDARYLGAAVPPFCIAIAAVVVAAAEWLRPRLRFRPSQEAPRSRLSLPPQLALSALASLLAAPLVVPTAIGAGSNVDSLVAENGIDPSRQVVAELAARARPGDVVLALNAQTYFPLAYYLDSTGEGERLGLELYEFHRPTAAYFTGWQDIDPERVIEPEEVWQLGWQTALGMPFPRTVWLVATDSRERDFGLFAPYEACTGYPCWYYYGSSYALEETATFLVPGLNRTGEIRSAVIVSRAIPL